MNIQQAKTAMRRLVGKNAAYRYDEKAPTEDDRVAARSKLPELKADVDAAKLAMQQRRQELLSDPEYQRLVAEWQAADKAHGATLGLLHHHRVTIMKGNGMFNTVVAEGDNWQDA